MESKSLMLSPNTEKLIVPIPMIGSKYNIVDVAGKDVLVCDMVAMLDDFVILTNVLVKDVESYHSENHQWFEFRFYKYDVITVKKRKPDHSQCLYARHVNQLTIKKQNLISMVCTDDMDAVPHWAFITQEHAKEKAKEDFLARNADFLDATSKSYQEAMCDVFDDFCQKETDKIYKKKSCFFRKKHSYYLKQVRDRYGSFHGLPDGAKQALRDVAESAGLDWEKFEEAAK